jgi:hypothetical protein
VQILAESFGFPPLGWVFLSLRQVIRFRLASRSVAAHIENLGRSALRPYERLSTQFTKP